MRWTYNGEGGFWEYVVGECNGQGTGPVGPGKWVKGIHLLPDNTTAPLKEPHAVPDAFMEDTTESGGPREHDPDVGDMYSDCAVISSAASSYEETNHVPLPQFKVSDQVVFRGRADSHAACVLAVRRTRDSFEYFVEWGHGISRWAPENVLELDRTDNEAIFPLEV
jgi:hypothetical protein